ncbi:hypothetical protein XhyaCFBP1156_16915 [Xanthomonas hyacinthi]|uniref:TonB C-terminal domain-containing protein n=2 Tax=Xanthomonas hyacinthi TaxID=56455 RepID=A0A2S7ES40_9XANT|nr:hypothetical protein XhyaCFBP1156_16915 [Xanthomonas hyacinthi]
MQGQGRAAWRAFTRRQRTATLHVSVMARRPGSPRPAFADVGVQGPCLPARQRSKRIMKRFHRTTGLAWRVMLLACWVWTVPASAQLLDGSDVRQEDELMLTCRGLLEAFPKSGDSKQDKSIDESREMFVFLTDSPDFRKRNPSEKERNQYIGQGRKVWQSADRKQFDQQVDNCAALIDSINEIMPVMALNAAITPPLAGEAQAQSQAAGAAITDDEIFEIWMGGIFKKSMEYASEMSRSADDDMRSAFKGNEEKYASCMKGRVAKTPIPLRNKLISYLRNTFMAGKSESLFPDIYNDYWLGSQSQCTGYLANEMLARENVASDASAPRLLSRPSDISIYYPKSALKSGVEGRTVARCALDAAGRARKCAIASSSGSAALDAATLKVIDDMLWEPATAAGGNTERLVAVPMTWKQQ